MKRRDALKNSGLLVGCGLSAGTIAAFISACNTETLPAGTFFSSAAMKLLSAVVDTFLPKTDTPSATEAGVHTFLDANIATVMTKEEQILFAKSLSLVEEHSKKSYNKPFADLTQEDREKVLLDINGIEAMGNPFKLLQKSTLYVYYTSELGATKALNYVSVPGEYLPCIPLSEVGKAWAL